MTITRHVQQRPVNVVKGDEIRRGRRVRAGGRLAGDDGPFIFGPLDPAVRIDGGVNAQDEHLSKDQARVDCDVIGSWPTVVYVHFAVVEDTFEERRGVS